MTKKELRDWYCTDKDGNTFGWLDVSRKKKKGCKLATYKIPVQYQVYQTPSLTSGIWTMTDSMAQLGGSVGTTITATDSSLNYYYQVIGNQVATNWQQMYASFGAWEGLQPQPETAEQKAARLKRAEELAAAKKVAEDRARNLLFTILTPSQVKQYTDDAYFDMEVNGRIYRLNSRSYSRNVELIENGKVKELLCAHPNDAHILPIPDVLLSQFLMIKSNEQEFLRIANRTVVQ